MKNKLSCLAVGAVFALGLCSLTLQAKEAKAKSAPAKAAADSIYARLGGEPAINAAVDLFYTKVLADKSVNHFFEDVNMKKQHRKQKAFIAAALGGPTPWEGKNMRKAHQNLDLKESDFNAIAGHLQATLKELKIDEQLIGEVMAVVGSTKKDVLGQ